MENRVKSKSSLSSECVETKLCKPWTSFTSHLHSWCGMVWYRTLRAEFSFENADVKIICYCEQRMKSKLSLFRMCGNEAL